MDNLIRDILRKDMNLYRKYDRAEASYVLKLKDDYELVDVDLNVDDETFEKFIKDLAQKNMCIDEWAKNVLTKMIEQKEKEKNEKISKYSKNMED